MTAKRDLKSRFFNNTALILSILVFSQCKKENNYTATEKEIPTLGAIPGDLKLATTGITLSSYYLVNALPAGYVKDGSRDYTSYVQAAVTKYSNIVFPAFPIQVNDKGIIIGSNKVITFEPGSQIRLKPTSLGTYNILKIAAATNVTLYNPVIIGDRATHTGTTGEHGMGIAIWGSSNVTIYNPKVSYCWGDGIYLGQAGNSINCKNITIQGAWLKKNRRSGITVIGVDGLLMDNLYAGYNDGTSPYSGINFEPNNSTSEFKNVRLNNPRTEFNKNGIQIGVRRMLATTNKYLDITVVNHTDIGSTRYPFKVACSPTVDITAKMYGLIKIANPSWRKTATETNVYLWLSSNQVNLKTAITSPEIMNLSGTMLSWTDTYNLLIKAARGGSLTVTQTL